MRRRSGSHSRAVRSMRRKLGISAMGAVRAWPDLGLKLRERNFIGGDEIEKQQDAVLDIGAGGPRAWRCVRGRS